MFLLFFYFHAPSPPEIYTLSLHDALPISTFRPRPRFMDCRNEKGSSAMKKLFLPFVAVAALAVGAAPAAPASTADRKSTRLNSSHLGISYAVFCLKKKNKNTTHDATGAHW